MFYDYDCKLFAHGLQALSDRQVLEILLCNITNKREIDVIISEVGSSFVDVVNLGYERLSYVTNISQKVIYYLEFLREFTSRYLASSYIRSGSMSLDTSEKLCEYFRKLFVGIKREELHIMGLDDELCIKCKDVLSTGAPDTTSISIRKITEFTIFNNVSRIVLAHNHPQGLPCPSEEDMRATKDVVYFMRKMRVEVIDHIVVGNGGTFSMRASQFVAKIWR